MLSNYLKLAFRNIRRQKIYSAVNILGLAIGLTSCLLIALFAATEWSFDRFHESGSDLYRLNWDFRWDGSEGIGSGTPPPLAGRIVQDFPEVEASTRIYPVAPMVVRHDDLFFTEDRIRAVDSNFLDLFSFELVAGDRATALEAPGSVILTERIAEKYFGDSPALGVPLTIGRASEFLGRPYDEHFTVTGIIANPPDNSHIQFDILTSMSSHPQVAFFDWSWIWMQVVTYAQLKPGASTADLEAKMVDMVATYAPDAFDRVGFSYDEMMAAGGRWNFVLQPLHDVYLGSAEIGNRLGLIGNRTYLSVMIVLGVFIVLIACVNFMNLSTARSTTRAKEIGVRKTLGSERSAVARQFLVEAIVFAMLSMLIALTSTALLVKPFGAVAGRAIDGTILISGWLPFALLGFVVVVGLLAGSYPSTYLSRFAPIDVLKGQIRSSGGGAGVRNGLVVFQFAVSIALICCTLVVYSQIRFFDDVDKGFEPDGVVVISNHDHLLGNSAEAFRDQLAALPRVISASLTTGVPPYYGFQDYYKVEGRTEGQFDLISYQVDDQFVQTLDLEILQGRGFSDEFGSDSASVILNEAAVRFLGWEDPVGQRIEYPGATLFTVIGVMRDFNFTSMHQPIAPFALFHASSKGYAIQDSYIVARMSAENLETTLASTERIWTTLAPGSPFQYSFLDDNFEGEYTAERRLGTIFVLFSGLAILIACLGLFGLATFTVERRTKEIGLRKTLGASVPNVIALLTKDFTRWVLLANLIAWPIAWYVMDRWLEGFAYRITLGPELFLAGALVGLFIAASTVVWQTVRAAVADPVKSLRYE